MGGGIFRGEPEDDPQQEAADIRETLDWGAGDREFLPICEHQTKGLRVKLTKRTKTEHCLETEYSRGFEDQPPI